MLRYFIIYKPFRILSQFTSAEGKLALKDIFTVPRDVYPVGRLDYDSEGLLILTNDTSINHRLLDPKHAHEREYWVQVEGAMHTLDAARLEKGITINIDGKDYKTKPCKATLFDKQPPVPDRDPPIRFRKNIPTTWIKLILTEGKNRQVRKMTAKAGFPTLRLIRQGIGGITLNGMQPGDMKELNPNYFITLL